MGFSHLCNIILNRIQSPTHSFPALVLPSFFALQAINRGGCNCKSENLASDPRNLILVDILRSLAFSDLFFNEKKHWPGKNHILDLQW